MAGGGGQQGGQEGSMGIIWVVAAVFVILGLLWFYLKAYIIFYFLKIKLLEIGAVSLFTHGLDDVYTAMIGVNPASASLGEVLEAGQAVGQYIRIPCAFILVVCALAVYIFNVTRSLKQTYSMHSLAKLEKLNWPQISPVIDLDLVKVNINKGPWAMAMTPMQFCKKYNLLEEFRRQNYEGMARKDMNKIEVNLKRGQANKIFIMQLGSLWAGTSRLPPYAKALFAVFAARHNGDSKMAFQILQQLAVSCMASKMNFSGVDALCKKHESSAAIQKITQSHAYVLTVMASMLVAARDDGVQASADFLWLKPVDRKLWYMLNTVGRQTPFVEVGGCFAHWVAEKEMGRKLIVPMIEEATNALELALKDVIYRPGDEE
jgi:intracellular multiplication protein IcmP